MAQVTRRHRSSLSCFADSSVVGKLLNRDYRIVAKKNKFLNNQDRSDDFGNFPIEKARLRSVWASLVIAIISIAGYGWTLQAETVRSIHF